MRRWYEWVQILLVRAEPGARVFLVGSQGKASEGYLYTAELICNKACTHTCTLTDNSLGEIQIIYYVPNCKCLHLN